MTPHSPTNSNAGCVSTPPEILTDEEIRSRAAAYAQQVYEQQLEAYKAQREQVLAARQAQAEYEQQRQAYEQACRIYYAQQQSQPAVRVDPETGEQVYAETLSDYSPEQENISSEEGYVESEITTEDENMEFAENESSSTVGCASTEDKGDAFSILDESIPAEKSGVVSIPINKKNTKKRAASSDTRFPVFSILLIVICVAGLGALGYILFSEDPRFEEQRGKFFSLIGWENVAKTKEEPVLEAPSTKQEMAVPVEEETESISDNEENEPAPENEKETSEEKTEEILNEEERENLDEGEAESENAA